MARLVLILSLTLATPLVARAQPACAPLDSAFQALRDAYGEVPQVEWQDGAGNRFVVLASPEGSVTVLFIPESNSTIACIATSGTGYRKSDDKPGRGA